MSKLVLNDITGIMTAVPAINNNMALIEQAVENTLSRDGTSPNYMNTSLDMNGYPIQNVGRAVNINDALTYAQFLEVATTEELTAGVIPITWELSSTGVIGYTLPFLSVDVVDMFIVSVDGLIYPPSTYNINPTTQTITFLSNIPLPNQEIVVRLFGKTPEATTESITVSGLRATSIQTVVGTETVFNTIFTLESSSTDVFLNGVKLVYSVDYTVAINSITLTAPAMAGDTLEIISHSVILAVSDEVLAVQQAAIDAENAAAAAAQSVLDAAAAGAAAGAIAGAIGINWLTKTANYTASTLDGIFADTSAGSFTVTLPATPSIGNQVYFMDITSSFGLHALTIGRNSEYIMGLDEDMLVNTPNASFRLTYTGAANGWRIG